jgi:hypothetical protein
MKMHLLQTTLAGGVLDGGAMLRLDTPLYRNGASDMVNCLPLAAGGQLSRWGTKYLGTLAAVPVMAEFTFSADQAYIAVFTQGRVDFFYASDGLAAGSLTSQPWVAGQLRELRIDQGGDLMWVAHSAFNTVVIRRTGTNTWTAEGMSYDSIAGTPLFRYADGGITAKWDLANTRLEFSDDVLVVGHVGLVLRVRDENASSYRYGTIATVITPRLCTVTWVGGFAPPDNKPTLAWEEQAFSAVRGWPRTVALHRQRLVFGGSTGAGDAVWLSKVGQFFNFDLGVAAANEGIQITLGSTRVRSIIHTVSGPQLTFFTEAGVYFLAEDETRPITPASARPRLAGPYGTNNARPGAFDGGMLMVQGKGTAVRDLSYSSEAANLLAPPVSLAYTDRLGPIVDAAYMPGSQARPEQYAFFLSSDGTLHVFHSIREERVGAWLPWRTNGQFRAIGQANGVLFAAVQRGASIMLERFDPALAFDCAATTTLPVTVAHLAGSTVHVRAGDDYLGSAVAGGGGAVALASQAVQAGALPAGTAVEAGLAFDWRITPLPPALDLNDGTIIQRPKRLVTTHVRAYRARSLSMRGGAMVLLQGGFPVGAPPASASRWVVFRHLGLARSDDDAALTPTITRDVPMPTGILGFKREVSV